MSRKGMLCFAHTGELGNGRNSSDLTAKSKAEFDFLALQLKCFIVAMPSLGSIRVFCSDDFVDIESARYMRDKLRGAKRGKSEIKLALNGNEPFRIAEFGNHKAKKLFIMLGHSGLPMSSIFHILDGHCDSIAYFEMMLEMLERECMGHSGRLDVAVVNSELLFFMRQLMEKRQSVQSLTSFKAGEAIAIRENRTWAKLSTEELNAGFK